MSPLQGFTRLRKNQIGMQSALGTPATATRVLPLRGVPNVNRNWTEPDVDTGSLFPILPPFRGPEDNTQSLSGQADYNSLIYLMRMCLGPVTTPVAGAGDAQTWIWEVDGDTSADFEYATIEFGDDAGDAFKLSDSIVESLRLQFADKGAVTADASVRIGTAEYPASLTGSLSALDLDYFVIYGKDCSVFLDDTSGGIGSTELPDAHAIDLAITNTVDLKRFADGSQSFGVSAYGRSGMEVVARFTFAKTAAVLDECENWAADAAVDRYISLSFASTENIETGPDVPYSLKVNFPARWYVHEESEVGGNAVVVLEGHAFYDADLYPLKVTIVGTETDA